MKADWELNKHMASTFDLNNMLKLTRNADLKWKQLDAQCCQQICDRIVNGRTLFFTMIKKGQRASLPKFKSKHKYKSITFKQCGYKLIPNTNQIRIGRRTFKYHKDRETEGNIKTLTVKRNKLGEFFIFITTDHTDKHPKISQSGKSVGFDFGLKTFLTGSDGTIINSPQFFKQDIRRIKKLHKQLSSKKKDSKNRKRARKALARAYEDIANKHNNFHWQVAYKLVKTYDTICFETLNMKGMQKLWGRKISDLGFYSFLQIIQYLAQKYDCKIVFIDRFYPSSKTCNCCETINKDLHLQDREWDCSNCNSHLDRDLNAAINIHRVGTSTLAGVDVRPNCPNQDNGHSAKIAQS